MIGVVFGLWVALAQVLPLAAPPPGPAASSILDAMMAIARARVTNPTAASAAQFPYAKAIERATVGDYAAARASAAQATLQAGMPVIAPVTPTILPPIAPVLPIARTMPMLSDPAAIDANAFIALARGTLADCATRHDGDLAAAQSHLRRAQTANAAGRYQTVRFEAKAAIDACAVGASATTP